MEKKINKYLAGDLEGKELEQFEARLLQDSQLKAEVERKNKLLDDSIREGVQYYYELETMIQGIHEKVQQEKKKDRQESNIRQLAPNRNITKWWIAAAALALFIVAYFLIIKKPNQEQIIAQWENTIPTKFPLRTAGVGNIEQLKSDAEDAYAQKDYATAKLIFNQILQDTLIEKIVLGRGLCELQLENYTNAIRDFETIEATNMTFRTQATWFKGVAYLKNGEIAECIRVLETLVNNNAASEKEKVDARELLQQLQSLD